MLYRSNPCLHVTTRAPWTRLLCVLAIWCPAWTNLEAEAEEDLKIVPTFRAAIEEPELHPGRRANLSITNAYENVWINSLSYDVDLIGFFHRTRRILVIRRGDDRDVNDAADELGLPGSGANGYPHLVAPQRDFSRTFMAKRLGMYLVTVSIRGVIRDDNGSRSFNVKSRPFAVLVSPQKRADGNADWDQLSRAETHSCHSLQELERLEKQYPDAADVGSRSVRSQVVRDAPLKPGFMGTALQRRWSGVRRAWRRST